MRPCESRALSSRTTPPPTHATSTRLAHSPSPHSLHPRPPPPAPRQATEIYYDPDPKTTIIEEDREWVEGYFDLNEGAAGGWLKGGRGRRVVDGRASAAVA